jgi:hypothetical protein
MIRRVSPLVLALVLASATAGAQAPAGKAPAVQIPAGVAGNWEGKTMIGPKDSVITTFVMTATSSASGWTMKLATRPQLPARIIAAGGDSVVVEIGPYESILRKGQQATTRTTGHYKGDMMTGTFEAKYSNGEVVKGKSMAMRAKKTP